jgi:hypothetical protein
MGHTLNIAVNGAEEAAAYALGVRRVEDKDQLYIERAAQGPK